MPLWTQQQIHGIGQLNHQLLTRRIQQKLRPPFKHKSIRQADLKFAEKAFVAMGGPVTGCPEKLCLPVTARYISLELSVREVSLDVFQGLR